MARVLVTEPLAEAGLRALRDAGHDVEVKVGLSADELLGAVAGAEALIVRSATQVTAAVVEAAKDLVVVGRAGTGVDNIDVAAATKRGVLVVNAAQSNSISAAEHTIAMLLAQARSIPQAHAALKAGRWERSRWEGVELHGKTLGVLGLGRVGTLVSQRAHAFGMRLLAWDPWVAEERARKLGIELVELDELFATADFVSVHLLKTPESVGLVGKDLLAHAKPTLRIVNTGRGGIIDEPALAEAIASGTVAGAALDVFAVEPTTASPLFELEQVVVTPHLAASTQEAQDKAGETIAQQVNLALAGEIVPFAINVEAAEAPDVLRPFLSLAERLGGLFARLVRELPGTITVGYQGELAGYDTRIVKLAVLKGLLSAVCEEPVTYVNAPGLAEGRGLLVQELAISESDEYVSLLSIEAGEHNVAGTLAGVRGEPRIVKINGHDVELPLAEHVLLVKNDDRVGMMALVTGVVADAGVNIADMRLGRSPAGQTALALITADSPIPAEVEQRLRDAPGILDVRVIAGL